MEAPAFRQRLVRGTQAQAAGLIVRAVVQVGAVSILAAVWGLQLYGEWLILAAVPAYIAVSDIGLFTAASNDMIMRVARDDREGALVTFQASTAAVTVLFALVVVVLFAVAAAAPLASWLNLEVISENTAAGVLVILGLNTMLVAYAGVLYGVLASEGLYGEGVFALAGITLIEFCGLAAVVLLGGGPALAAGAMFATRLPGTMAMFLYARRRVPWLLLGRPVGVGRALKPLITPSLASAAFPAGFALNIQGMVILVGVVLGPASTAVFSTLRTMSRLIVQALASVPAVIAPEISKAFAEDDIDRLRSLHRRGCQAVVWIAAPIVAILALFGQSIVSTWTSGTVEAQGGLLYLFLAVAALSALWLTSLAVMFARNRHQSLAIYFVVSSALALPVAYLSLQAWGLDGAAASRMLEAVMVVVTLRQTIPAAGDTFVGWLGQVMKPPPLRAILVGPRARVGRS